MCDKCHTPSQIRIFFILVLLLLLLFLSLMLLSIMFQSYNESQLFYDIVPGQASYSQFTST